MKYKVGQKVKVKEYSELKKGNSITADGAIVIDDCFFLRQMKVYCNEEYTIISQDCGCYELNLTDGGKWWFTDNMLDPVDLEEIEIDITENKRGRKKKE